MVLGMPGCMNRTEAQGTYLDLHAVLSNMQPVLRDRQESPPQSLHLIAIDPASTREQLLGVAHMRRADRMHIDIGALPCEPTRGTGMIQVNVRQQDMSNVLER